MQDAKIDNEILKVLSTYKTVFRAYLQTQNADKKPERLYEPVTYILDQKAKRLRPLFVLLAYQLKQSNIEPALPVAAAIEVFHNFTLLHDDIMDQADSRRGQPAVHIKYGVNGGILSGDLMLIQAYQQLQKGFPNAQLAKAMELFTQTAIEVCEGQQWDMDFEQSDEVTIEQYLEMIKLKTAVLLAVSLQLGGLAAALSAEDQEHLYQLGISIGMAFQMQDDILDAYGDPQKVGKKPGGDIIQNKKTYLTLKAKELANKDQFANIQQLIHDFDGSDEEKVRQMIDLYEALGVRKYAQELKQKYHQAALDHLNAIEAPADRKAPLFYLLDYILVREE